MDDDLRAFLRQVSMNETEPIPDPASASQTVPIPRKKLAARKDRFHRLAFTLLAAGILIGAVTLVLQIVQAPRGYTVGTFLASWCCVLFGWTYDSRSQRIQVRL